MREKRYKKPKAKINDNGEIIIEKEISDEEKKSKAFLSKFKKYYDPDKTYAEYFDTHSKKITYSNIKSFHKKLVQTEKITERKMVASIIYILDNNLPLSGENFKLRIITR